MRDYLGRTKREQQEDKEKRYRKFRWNREFDDLCREGFCGSQLNDFADADISCVERMRDQGMTPREVMDEIAGKG